MNLKFRATSESSNEVVISVVLSQLWMQEGFVTFVFSAVVTICKLVGDIVYFRKNNAAVAAVTFQAWCGVSVW